MEPFNAKIRHQMWSLSSSIESSIFSTATFVLKYVSVTTKKELRRLYDNAFREWALEMSRLQEARKLEPRHLGVREAESKSEAAETAYRTARDQLAEALGAAAAAAYNDH